MISFLGYRSRFQNEKQIVKDITLSVARTGDFILKGQVQNLEDKLKELIGAKYICAVGNGTQGLTLAMHSLQLEPFSNVITPAFSFIASASSIALSKLKPSFCDVDLNTGVMSLQNVQAATNSRTSAVMAVHLFSSLSEIDRISEFCNERSLALIEDSAVACGAQMNGRMIGTFGKIGVLSFFPAKPLGGIGEAAVTVTNIEAIDKRVRMLRNHGQDGKIRFLHHLVGFNHRMDEITACYLQRKLELKDLILRRRNTIGKRYEIELCKLFPRISFLNSPHQDRIFYNFAIRVKERERFQIYLQQMGIETKVFYPIPLHLQPVFKALGYKKGDFPNSECLAEECIALPLYPELSDEDVEYIIDSIKSYFGATSHAQAIGNY